MSVPALPVRRFAGLLNAAIANDFWKASSPAALALQAEMYLQRLKSALVSIDESDDQKYVDSTIQHAVTVAARCLMLVDLLGGLGDPSTDR